MPFLRLTPEVSVQNKTRAKANHAYNKGNTHKTTAATTKASNNNIKVDAVKVEVKGEFKHAEQQYLILLP